jgi:hypothetical protein
VTEIKAEKQITITLQTEQIMRLNTLLALAEDELQSAIKRNGESDKFYKGYTDIELRNLHEFCCDLRATL